MLKKILLGVILNGLALYGVTQFLTGIHYTGGLKFFVIGGIVIGVLNTFVKPLMKIISFPVVFLTAGLFIWVINVFIFWLTVKIVNGISIGDVSVAVNGLLNYIIAALVFAILNWLLHLVIRNK